MLKEGDVYGSNYGQTWNGYFTAPVSGTYVFRGIADDFFAFYISSTYGSTDLPAAPLIYSNNHQLNWNNFYYDDSQYGEASVTLIAGKSYYIEAYHINNAGGGYFKVEVDVPNTDTTLPFQAFEVHKIAISAPVQPEVVNYTMLGGSTGTINLKIVRTSGGKVSYNVNTTINYGCTAEDFQSALNRFDSFSKYQISVDRFIYDSSDTILNTTVGAARIVYVVSFYLLRSDNVSSENFIYAYTNYTGTIVKTSWLTHSPLITGNFTLTIGGVQNSIAYNAGASTVQTLIRKIVGYENVLVDQVSQNGAGYDNTWIISYVGVNGTVPNPSVSYSGLTGGATSPTATITVRRPYSTAITFNPIDYRFLNTYSNKPNVLVSTNGVPAICTADCSY